MNLCTSARAPVDNLARDERAAGLVRQNFPGAWRLCDTSRVTKNDHSEICRCSLHAQLQARRHEAYRQLAFAILGPSAPREDDTQLARALAQHADLTPCALRVRSGLHPAA
jgi:hypothetical protein